MNKAMFIDCVKSGLKATALKCLNEQKWYNKRRIKAHFYYGKWPTIVRCNGDQLLLILLYFYDKLKEVPYEYWENIVFTVDDEIIWKLEIEE